MTDRLLVKLIAGLAVAGLAIAGYLTYVHYAGVEPVCAAGSGGCHKVQNSQYAELAGIPVALLGLVGYALILVSLLWRSDAGKAAGAVLALSGAGFSAYLTYREVVTLDAICQWCVASALVMTALAALTVWRLARLDDALVAAPRTDS